MLFRITSEQHPGHGFVKINDSIEQLSLRDSLRTHVEHPARCDFCQNMICGTRYKCASCTNFDLCQNCEALPISVHDSTHNFLKLKTPQSLVFSPIQCTVSRPPVFPADDYPNAPSPVLNAVHCMPSPTRVQLASETPSTLMECFNVRPSIIPMPRLSPVLPIETPTYSPEQYYEPLYSMARSPGSDHSNPFTDRAASPRFGLRDDDGHAYSPVPSDQLEFQRADSPETGFQLPMQSRPRSFSPTFSEGLYATPPTPPTVNLPDLDVPSIPPAPLIPPLIPTVWTPPITTCTSFSWWPNKDISQRREITPPRGSTPEDRNNETVELPETLPTLEARTPDTRFSGISPMTYIPRYMSFIDSPISNSPIAPRTPEQQTLPWIGNLVDLSESAPLSNQALEEPSGAPEINQIRSRGESEGSLPRLGPVNAPGYAELWPELTSMLSHLLRTTSPPPNLLTSAEIPGSVEIEELKVEQQSSESAFVTPVEDSPIDPESLLSRRNTVVAEEEQTRLALQSFLQNIVPRLPTPPPTYIGSYVEDVNIEDGQFFPPGAEFVKTWRMKNDGADCWPEGTHLVHVAGDRMAPRPSGTSQFKVGSVKPGEEVEVSAGEMKVRYANN